MAASKTKRIALMFLLLLIVAVVGALVLGFMLSRDVPFDTDHPNSIEASEAARKVKLYETSLQNGQRGFVRFSELEINSHLTSLLNPTNKTTNAIEAEVSAGPVKLRKVALQLTSTNMVLYSWGKARALGLPLEFVVQRGLKINQEGTNQWTITTEFMKVGELEIEQKHWPRFETYLAALDKPLMDLFPWSTNIQAMIVAKNDLSQRPEFRLYTFKPIPADVR